MTPVVAGPDPAITPVGGAQMVGSGPTTTDNARLPTKEALAK